jgi:hypothetical protein
MNESILRTEKREIAMLLRLLERYYFVRNLMRPNETVYDYNDDGQLDAGFVGFILFGADPDNDGKDSPLARLRIGLGSNLEIDSINAEFKDGETPHVVDSWDLQGLLRELEELGISISAHEVAEGIRKSNPKPANLEEGQRKSKKRKVA